MVVENRLLRAPVGEDTLVGLERGLGGDVGLEEAGFWEGRWLVESAEVKGGWRWLGLGTHGTSKKCWYGGGGSMVMSA